jgi:hypothetical protein
MLVVDAGQSVEIPFVYRSGFNYIDPTEDIFFYLRRGYGGQGGIILGPYKFNISSILGATPGLIQSLDENSTVERSSIGSYILNLKMPNDIFEGVYTIQISTTADQVVDLKEYYVQVLKKVQENNEVFSPLDKKIVVNNFGEYQNMSLSETNSILLIGHTDAIEPFSIHRIVSMNDAVNKLRADFESPLLRGVFDAYSSGGRNIYIMSAGKMSEYIKEVERRNLKVFADDFATPNEFGNTYSFYELYSLKLDVCYNILKDYEFIDIIVPLEASMVDADNVNFVSQLALHCNEVQKNTGEVQIGIIGSRSITGTSSNVDSLSEKDFEIYSDVAADGAINADAGKYIILIYGEAVFSYNQLQRTYSGSVAAAYAGALASTRVDYGLTRKKMPAALSVYGNGLTTSQIKILTDKKINCLVNGNRSRRNVPFDVLISGDLTQSISENYSDASNVRLVAMIIAEIQSFGSNAIGKFSHDRLIRNVDALLNILKSSDIIRDYYFDAFADRMVKGKIYFNISVVSVRTLRSISFNVGTGKGS